MKGNAKITGTMLGYEDHGILTCLLNLRQEGTAQGFGGYRLDAPKGWSIYTDFWVKRILEVVGVECWEDLKGKYVRVDGDEWGAIKGIGHITDDKWFYPEREIDAIKANPKGRRRMRTGIARKKPVEIKFRIAEQTEEIKTLEGTMRAEKGDFIITGVKGEQYPCKPDIFHATYDILGEENTPVS